MSRLKLKKLLNSELKCRFYCADSRGKTNVYSKTVLLPSTGMPLYLEKEKLVKRDIEMNAIHEKVYKWQESKLKEDNTFILHDGPPYANGPPHMGHAINKILKDAILRTELLKGRRVNYIPGWDCHGLPIELKATKESKEQLVPLQIRQKAREFAQETINVQMKAFQSWGVIGDWENGYKTFSKSYVKNQLRRFYELYEKKLIYRDVKPVYWSPSSRTALAEAELEYNATHKSIAATVKMKAAKLPDEFQIYSNVHFLIWTTTPWTLPGNQAICFNQDLSYCLIKPRDEHNCYIMAVDLVPQLSQETGKDYQVLELISGNQMKEMTYLHPFLYSELPLLHSSHATNTKGTGLVHIAPAHGPEDFLVALENNMKIICLVDANGMYTNEAGLELAGLSVLSNGGRKILQLLAPNIIHQKEFTHSYPYDWRTKQPVLLRASHQWFIDMNPIRQQAIEHVKKVKIIPNANAEMYKKNLMDQIQKRPYWCISRQRCWGVPIPVFYEIASKKVLLNKAIIEHFCHKIDSDGCDFWWKLSKEQLLPLHLLPSQSVSYEDVEKGEDILDIWFDSGISWSSALHGQVADMYLEGIDQFTGWFQSSLITSVALRNNAPYKCIYVHGFAVDENGSKMSKSLGNVVDPQEIMIGSKGRKALGIDALRWWVACHANQDTIAKVSDSVLKVSADEVQKIRSVLRFAVGNLSDYAGEQIPYDDLKMIDKHMLSVLHAFYRRAEEVLHSYEFNKLRPLIINLVSNDISALYYTAIKDRLYCDAGKSPGRLAAQYVLFNLVQLLTQSIAPIVPHLAEEIFAHLQAMNNRSDTFFMRDRFYDVQVEWEQHFVQDIMELILEMRAEIYKVTRNASDALESHVAIHLKQSQLELVKKHVDINDLCDIFQVAEVSLAPPSNIEKFQITVTKSEQFKCPRCRKINALMSNTLCDRCFDVVNKSKFVSEISHLEN